MNLKQEIESTGKQLCENYKKGLEIEEWLNNKLTFEGHEAETELEYSNTTRSWRCIIYFSYPSVRRNEHITEKIEEKIRNLLQGINYDVLEPLLPKSYYEFNIHIEEELRP